MEPAMSSRRLTLVFALIWLIVPARIAGAAVTMEQVRQTFKNGDWSGTLRAISEATAARGERAAEFDRYELFMLKGQSLLHLKNSRMAATAFDDARKASEELSKRAQARAWGALARRTQGEAYKPKEPANSQPIALFASDGSVNEAMMALRADLLADNKTRIERAEQARSLDPIFELVPALGDIYALEFTASGGTAEQTEPILRELGGHARELINREIKLLYSRSEQLRLVANDLVDFQGDITQRGLYSNDRAEVEKMIPYVAKIEDVGREGRRLAQLMGGAVDEWQQIVTRCEELTDELNLLLSGPGVRGG
jgi:hypothetical protein